MRYQVEHVGSKVEALRIMWENHLIKWERKAMATGDPGMRALIKEIRAVTPEVRGHLLRQYVKQCKKKHAIAFLEWRLHFSQNRAWSVSQVQLEDDEIHAIIDQRIYLLKLEFRRNVEQFDLMDDTIEIGAYVPIKTNKTYDFKYEPKQYLIDSFQVIGWPDPFPRAVLTGKFHMPSISAEKTADYKKWVIKENNQMLEADDYIFESFNVNPELVVQENLRQQ